MIYISFSLRAAGRARTRKGGRKIRRCIYRRYTPSDFKNGDFIYDLPPSPTAARILFRRCNVSLLFRWAEERRGRVLCIELYILFLRMRARNLQILTDSLSPRLFRVNVSFVRNIESVFYNRFYRSYLCVCFSFMKLCTKVFCI